MAKLSSNLLAYRIAIAAQEGADVTAILQASEAPPNLMQGDPEFVGEEVERHIWKAIVDQTDREDIGLVCGQRFPSQAINMLGYVLANAPTIRVAIQKCCDYQRVIGDTMGLVLEHGTDTSTVWIEQWCDWHDMRRYTVDLIMASVTSWASSNAPGPVRPLRVGFHYQRPLNPEPYLDLFAPAPVTFGADRSYQIYANEALDQPVIGANREMFSFFEDKVQRLLIDMEGRDTYCYKARQQVLTALNGTTPEIGTIAANLAVSVRKLQQKLAEEGTSYSQILSQARCDLAKQYLSSGEVGNDEIAYLLGFSEVSVFSRSFKKWTGVTPSEYRARPRH